MATVRLTQNDRDMLAQVGKDNVTWRSDMGARVSYRLWSSERDYVLVTPRLKRLEKAGLVKKWHGWRHGAGGVELTPEGKAVA